MSRAIKIALTIFVLGVIAGGVYFRGLHRRLLQLAQGERTEEQVRREVTQPRVVTPTDVKKPGKIFWASPTVMGMVEETEVELSLSADAAQRARQVIATLIADAPTPEQRTLPADVSLLEFYLLPDGTAVADFSGALATGTPAGIASEKMALESIVRTLGANVPGVARLRILIQGQEVETLAGHMDLTGFLEVRAGGRAAEASPAAGEASAARLTPLAAPGKLP